MASVNMVILMVRRVKAEDQCDRKDLLKSGLSEKNRGEVIQKANNETI